MESLKTFIDLNMRFTSSSKENGLGDLEMFKKGIVSLDLILDMEPKTEAEFSRLCYLRNLCLVSPKPFLISSELSGLEKACMKLSFGDYDGIDLSMYSFRHELIGSVPTNKGVYGNSMLIVRCGGTAGRKKHVYSTPNYEFGNEAVESLTIEEQLILLVEMIRVFYVEIYPDLRRLKVQAYIDRILFPENEKSEVVRMAARYYLMALNLEPWEPEPLTEQITDMIFEVPFVFRSEWERLLGDAYYNYSAYGKALEYFEKYGCNLKAIECLFRLNRGDEAEVRALEEIERIGDPRDHQSRVRLCNMNIVLGGITGKEAYFDAALEACYSHEPLRAKGIYFFKSGNIEKAIASCEKALLLVPRNVEILFLYASALTCAKRFAEAAAIYEKLAADDPRNVVFLRNLAMCRIQLEDISGGLEKLKRASMYDENAMQAYFLMSIKYDIPEEIRYSLERVCSFDDLEEGVVYLVQSGTLQRDEVKAALTRNSRIVDVESLLKKIDMIEAQPTEASLRG